ncbi:MAG: flagellar hook-associated protein FlgL, partial [Synergistaceae bacterium]|nr:flagellar hook-associated protein FlgL [Synergistaceae bacterium]
MTYRVTNNMMRSLMMGSLNSNMNRLLEIQQQLATERKYPTASKNPHAVTKGMGLETKLTEADQYRKNLEDAVAWLKFTDDAMMQMNDLYKRVNELAIKAGDGSEEDLDRGAIGAELRQLKDAMMSFANSTIAGEYLFSGLMTDKTPFSLGENGAVRYNGNNYALFWEFAQRETGKVSITGREIFPLDETTNSLKGIEVPIDFQWKGRSEILEFKVGWRTVKVRIPERWEDEIRDSLADSSDYNRFRDPGEPLDGYSLDEIADLINNSTEMGDVSKLLKATVVKDIDNGVQYLRIQSLTGEPVNLTGWPETDRADLPEGIRVGDGPLGSSGIASDGQVTFRFSDNSVYSVDVAAGDTLEDVADKLNSLRDGRVWAAYKTDGTNEWIDIVGREPGDSYTIEASGGAADVIGSDIVGSEPIMMNYDHTHMGFAALMGIETSLTSGEYQAGSTAWDTTASGEAVHLNFVSGGRRAEVFIGDDADLTLEELAARISNVCGDWLEAVVEADESDGTYPAPDPLRNSGDSEELATLRLVLRTKDGSPFAVYDGLGKNGQVAGSYASMLGINTALSIEDVPVVYPDDEDAGMFDENMPATLEVTVGDRVYQVKVCKNNRYNGRLVAEAIRDQVNAQFGGTLISLGENISQNGDPNTYSVYAVTGEP